MKKSFFEYLGLADVERIHSQFLAWVLSPDCNAVNQIERKNLFREIFNVNGTITDIQTERNRIDILISTAKDIIVIENKIKSSQHSNQLENYRKFCKKSFPFHKIHYFFLTLIKEKTTDKKWKQLTYSTIFKHLSNLNLKANNNHSAIIIEYLIFLEKLDVLLEDIKLNIKNYDIIFLDGKKRKQDKKRSDYTTENEWFIAANQLETILQKSFLISVVDKIKISKGVISDTRGDALIDFPLNNNISFEGRKYSTALQLQLHTVKFTFAIKREIYLKSNKIWIDKIVTLMDILSKEGHFNYKKLNKPKKLAYVSISKKLDEKYWHKPFENLISYLQDEICNCKMLSEKLIQLIKD